MLPRTRNLVLATLLAVALPTAACPPSGDLWFVSQQADRVLVVDVLSVRRAVSRSLLQFVHTSRSPTFAS